MADPKKTHPAATLLEKIEADKANPPPPPPKPAGLGYDPVTVARQGIKSWIEARIPEGISSPMPGLSMRDFLMNAVPQTSPEAILMAATLPWGGEGGVAARVGLTELPLLKYLAQTGKLPGLARAAVRGGLTSLGGYLTGHDPTVSGAYGGLGSIAGEMPAAALNKAIQNAMSQRLVRAANQKLADWYRQTIPRWLPAGTVMPKAGDKAMQEANAEIFRAVAGNEPANAVGKEINPVKARVAAQGVKVSDLEPALNRYGISLAKPVGQGSTTPGGPGATVPGIVWPPTREFPGRLGARPPVAIPGEGVPAPSKLTPGEEIGPARPTPNASGEEMVPYGALMTRLDQALEVASEEAKKDPRKFDAVYEVNDLRQAVTQRLPDSADKTLLADLLKAYGRTKAASDHWWSGVRDAPRSKDLGPMFQSAGDEAPGLASPFGIHELGKRASLNTPNLQGPFTPDEVRDLRVALNQPVGAGVGVGVSGEGPKAYGRVGVGPTGPHGMTFHPTMPVAAAEPGWEAARTAIQQSAPGAVRALTPPVIARSVESLLSPTEAGAAELPTPLVDPRRLRDPYALPLMPPSAVAAPAPTSTRGPVDRWFNAPASPAAKELEVNLSTSQVPGE
jgi:hypothetical protein